MTGQAVPTLPTPPARTDFGGRTTKATFYDTIVGGTADSVGDIAWDERVTDGHCAGG